MRIDLHLHSPASKKSGDSIRWFGALQALKEMHARGVKAVAFTDHNSFNSKLFFELKQLSGGAIKIFPGVEIDILQSNNIRAHLLLIFNPEISPSMIMEIEKIARFHLKKRGTNIKKVLEIFKEYDYISIPHVGKADYFDIDELEFEHDAIEVTNFNHINYKKWIRKKNNKSIVAFSDTHIWDSYPQQWKLYTDIDFDGTFKGLKNKLKLKKNYTKELI